MGDQQGQALGGAPGGAEDAAGGQSSGGGAGSTTQQQQQRQLLEQGELRRRRIAALENREQQQGNAAFSASTLSNNLASSVPESERTITEEVADATTTTATTTTTTTTTTTSSINSTAAPSSSSLDTSEGNDFDEPGGVVTKSYKPSRLLSLSLSSSPPPAPPTKSPHDGHDGNWQVFTNVREFHSVMWDEATVTESDKLRWVSQGIDFRASKQDTVAADDLASGDDRCLSALESWGLVQYHGGPCGVLAAIQAEMFRILLFDEDAAAGKQATASHVLSRAISVLLARAAVAPTAEADDDGNKISGSESNADGSVSVSQQQQKQTSVVRIVLPRHRAALSWHDLEPWSESSNSAGGSLVVYTISVPPPGPDIDSATNENYTTDAKRQKTISGSGEQQQRQGESSEGLYVEALARSVGRFLEAPFADATGGSPGPPTTHPEHRQCPLDCYLQNGGVMLLVLSLVSSRGAVSLEVKVLIYFFGLLSLLVCFGLCSLSVPHQTGIRRRGR